MWSTCGIRPTSGCAAGSSKRTPPHASTVRAPVAAVAQQHRPSADRLVGQLVDVPAGDARGARDGVRHARRDQQEVAVPRRVGALPGRSSQASPSATKWKMAWSSAGSAEPPRRRQLAVAVEALDQPQIAQDLGQRVVRLGPGRLVQHDGLSRRSVAQAEPRREGWTIGYAFATSYHGPSGFRGVELFSSRLTGSAARRGSQPGSDIWRRLR